MHLMAVMVVVMAFSSRARMLRKMLDKSFPDSTFFVVVFLKWRLVRADWLHFLGQDRSTVAQRAETTVTECFLTSCV